MIRTNREADIFQENIRKRNLKLVNRIVMQSNTPTDMSEEDMKKVIAALSDIVYSQERVIGELSKMVRNLNNRTLVKKRFWQR